MLGDAGELNLALRDGAILVVAKVKTRGSDRTVRPTGDHCDGVGQLRHLAA